MAIEVSLGVKRGPRSRRRRVYVKLYEMMGDGKKSLRSASFTVYGIGVRDLEKMFRNVLPK